jgi:hypothetical protein
MGNHLDRSDVYQHADIAPVGWVALAMLCGQLPAINRKSWPEAEAPGLSAAGEQAD